MADAKAQDNKAYEFAMGFVSASDKACRQPHMQRWREISANFSVEPEYGQAERERSPYQSGYVYKPTRNNIVLKDPETHKLVMAYTSKLMLAIFGDNRGEYLQARPVGWEDAKVKAPTVTKLLRYAFGLPGHYLTFAEGITDLIQFGTTVFDIGYKYEERDMLVRSMRSELGVETSSETRIKVPAWDDVCIRPIDLADFYPDPARYRMQDMTGAAKRFRMNSIEARRVAGTGKYDSAAVERAIGGVGPESTDTISKDDPRESLTHEARQHGFGRFKDMVGYEYWGDVDWEENGATRRVITVLNGHVVRNDLWPLGDYCLPFHSFIINPVQGRFYGLAPAEVIRYDQSFADAMKILLAEAIVRMVHPPLAFDPDSDPDLSAIKAWRADALIPVRGGPASIGTLKYGADMMGGMNFLQWLKAGIQDGSGATGAIQGQEGPDRESASVGVRRLQFAMDRPELAAQIIERECLPSIGKAVLRRYQQFLGSTEDLKARVGELPEPAWIGDIMGDFDVSFVGSRQAQTRQQKIQAWQVLVQLSTAAPALAQMIPWQQIGRELIGDILELPEVAAMVADPMVMMQNQLLMQGMGQGAGENGIPQSTPAPDLGAEQAAGYTQ